MSEVQVAQPDLEQQRYQALLCVTDSVSLNDDPNALLHEIAKPLMGTVSFDFLHFVLHDPLTNSMCLKASETLGAPQLPLPESLPLDETPSGWVWEHRQPLLLHEIKSETRYPQVMEVLRASGIQSGCILPLATRRQSLGALGFLSRKEKAYQDSDIQFLQRVAGQVSLAVDNVTHRKNALAYQQQLAADRDQLQLLLEVNNLLVSNLEVSELFPAVAACLRRVIRHNYVSLSLLEAGPRRPGLEKEPQLLRVRGIVFPDSKGLIHNDLIVPLENSPNEWVLAHREPLLLDPFDTKKFSGGVTTQMWAEGVRCAYWLPLIGRNGPLGTLSVGSLQAHAFTVRDFDWLKRVASQIAIAVENALAFREIAELKDRFAHEKLYLEEEIRSEYNFTEIVGHSPVLQRILRQVKTVADTNATVLVLGETGTGKELIARAIHDLSRRRDQTFVKLNCAAIPTGLLESELFGHERGAFTGAISQKIGRLELAHKGTLFLDEVGDIPLELQPKLLRALQEREFERLGSTKTRRIDSRLIAATNRDLAHMVAEGSFRSDLYYRLSVFPLRIPPLRERREDIPLLVRYFTQKYCRILNRKVEIIPTETMAALVRWEWPGNIRELENLIERAVILSPASVLNVPLPELFVSSNGHNPKLDRLESAEREQILRVLRETAGVIGGPAGAAARLGVKRTTLNFKMKKLGISRADL
ncbi:MAG TPA: sigma 54-interacting transcriptional regulator [Terriglobales bacterium]|nr:sigma 54-interacting transcriptional regulator [Terriglobales bacterium]